MIKSYNYLYSPKFLNYNISSNLFDKSKDSEKLEIQFINEQEEDTNSFDSDKDCLASSDFNKYFVPAFDFVFNNIIEEDTNNSNENKRIIFNVENFCKKKRGRIPKNEKKRDNHGKNTDDNVISKIKSHSMKFIINLLNDCIPSNDKITKSTRFKHFNHQEKRNPNQIHIDELKNSTLNDLLNNICVSPKYKCNEYANRKLVDKYTKKNSFLKDLFKMEYLELFHYYYNGNKPTREIIINDKTIKLSENTETFFDLIEKNKDDKKHIERILEVAEKIFKVQKV